MKSGKIQVRVHRLEPEFIGKHKVAGYIGSFPFSEQWLSELEHLHGGGKYRVQLAVNGVVNKARVVEVGGSPKYYPAKKKCDCPISVIMSTGCQSPNHA